MSAEKSHRFALTGSSPDGGNRTIILRREADLVDGRVVLTLDATMNTATVLTPAEAIEVAQAIVAAAR